jgi:hypothetical protein
MVVHCNRVGLPDGSYVYLAGTLANDATESGDKLLLQTSKITCQRDEKICRIATASVFNHQVSVDDDSFDINAWTDRVISFESSAALCFTDYYTIDRATQSFTLISKKKDDVPDKVAAAG